ncbi:hypothetical protein ALC53_08304 [Atta colombica]|uniref:Uncharacterized protein n=1 Tax=Atta colombica TaxID=520822 RepID=A0A195B9M7_9HYME|nr:hypothetical protein ALC53_08304 [Atta colombica]
MENTFDIETLATISSGKKERVDGEPSISNRLEVCFIAIASSEKPLLRDGSLAYEASSGNNFSVSFEECSRYEFISFSKCFVFRNNISKKERKRNVIGTHEHLSILTHHRSGKQVHSTAGDDAPPDAAGDGAVDVTRVCYAGQPVRSSPYSSRLPTAARSTRSAPRLAIPPPYTLPVKDSVLLLLPAKKRSRFKAPRRGNGGGSRVDERGEYGGKKVAAIYRPGGERTSWGCIVRKSEGERERKRAGKVRTAGRASELTQRPPTITESIDQLGDLVAAHRSGAFTTASPTLLSSGLPFFSLTDIIRRSLLLIVAKFPDFNLLDFINTLYRFLVPIGREFDSIVIITQHILSKRQFGNVFRMDMETFYRHPLEVYTVWITQDIMPARMTGTMERLRTVELVIVVFNNDSSPYGATNCLPVVHNASQPANEHFWQRRYALTIHMHLCTFLSVRPPFSTSHL